MMDISDGLVRDAGRLCAASGVRVELDPQAVHADAARLAGTAAKLGADPLHWVLAGGEDHGLLAAFAAEQELPRGFRRVGSILARETPGGSPVTIGGREPAALGWDHFAG